MKFLHFCMFPISSSSSVYPNLPLFRAIFLYSSGKTQCTEIVTLSKSSTTNRIGEMTPVFHLVPEFMSLFSTHRNSYPSSSSYRNPHSSSAPHWNPRLPVRTGIHDHTFTPTTLLISTSHRVASNFAKFDVNFVGSEPLSLFLS